MVSTRTRAGFNKQADAGPLGPANITPDLAAILDGQAKMQQEMADLKKRSVDKMEALRQENSRLRRKIEADPTQKGKAKEASKATRSLFWRGIPALIGDGHIPAIVPVPAISTFSFKLLKYSQLIK